MDQRDVWRRVARDFYKTFCPPDQAGQLDYIDYNYPVRDVRIEHGTRLWGFKDPRVSPLKTTFFCIPGTPSGILGVHGAGNLKTHTRVLAKVLNEYEVVAPIAHALESVCADGLDAWSIHGQTFTARGGGWQYKIPSAHRYIRYTTPFPKR
jgi:Bacterial toxin 46